MLPTNSEVLNDFLMLLREKILKNKLKGLSKKELINLIIELSEDNDLFNDILSNLEYEEFKLIISHD